MISEHGYAILAFDNMLQGLGVVGAAIGVVLAAWALSDALYAEWVLRRARTNGIRRHVLRLHTLTHAVLVGVHAVLLTTAALTWSLPDVPMAMYASAPHGPWIVTVLVARKLGRLAITGALMGLSAYHVYWLRRMETLEHAGA